MDKYIFIVVVFAIAITLLAMCVILLNSRIDSLNKKLENIRSILLEKEHNDRDH